MKQTLNKLNTFIFILLFSLCVTQDGYCLDEQTRSSRYTSWLYTAVESDDDSEGDSTSADTDNLNQPIQTMPFNSTLYYTGAAIVFIAIPTIAYLLSNPDQQTIKMTNSSGNMVYISLPGTSMAEINNLVSQGDTYSFFRYGDAAVKCTLECINGLSGLCKTSIFRTHNSNNDWVDSPGDCMSMVDSKTTRLTDILWTTGSSIMGFLMTKRA